MLSVSYRKDGNISQLKGFEKNHLWGEYILQNILIHEMNNFKFVKEV